MTVPTSPYGVTDEMVALFMKNLLYGATKFTKDSALPKTTINQFISWATASVELKFSEAGFILPFVELTDETWPTHQTTYLQLVICIGVASWINPALKPAPAMGQGSSGSSETVFGALFKEELKRIYDGTKHAIRFRSQYYLGTPAEKALTEPHAPLSDWLENKVDKTKYMGLYDYTELMHDTVNVEVMNLNTKWDYVYDMFNKGLNV